jgi:ubiquitin carboxyl-terminal hydrolase 5/13
MFKQLVGHGHPEFSSMRQQDAQEYLQYLLNYMEKNERSQGLGTAGAFKFTTEERLRCLKCHKSRYRNQSTMSINLQLSKEKSIFDMIMQFFKGDTREFTCPHDNEKAFAEV